MKTKLLATLLTAVLLFGLCVPSAYAAKSGYTDTQDHWAESSIERWSDYGIVGGYGGGLFGPDDSITRGQMATILARLLALPEAESAGFADLAETAWYTDGINRCYAAGIMLGYNGKAMPNDPITREQTMVMLCRALGIEAETDADLSAYTDADEVSDYAVGCVAAMVECGIVMGTSENTLSPKTDIDRAAVTVVLDRSIAIYVNEDEATVDAADADGLILIAAKNVTVTNAPVGASVIVSETATGATVNGKSIEAGSTIKAEAAQTTKPTASSGGSNSGGNSGGHTPSYSNLTISEGKTVSGGIYQNVTITADVDNGEVTLSNATIRGDLTIYGGTIKLVNCTIKGKVVMANESGENSCLCLENTPIAVVDVKNNAVIEAVDDNSAVTTVEALADLEVKGENTTISTVTVPASAEDIVIISGTGTVSTVVVEAAVSVDSAVVDKVEVPEDAENVVINVTGEDEIVIEVNSDSTTIATDNADTVTISGSADGSVTLHIHAWGEGEITSEATCSAEGVRTYTCEGEDCPVGTKTEAVKKVAHTESVAVKENEVAVTCTEAGSYDEVVYCSVCGAEMSRELKTVDALDHDPDEVWSKDEDSHWHECARKNCDAQVDKAAHTWNSGEVTAEPTCTEKGIKTYTCTFCSQTKTEDINALSHDFTGEYSKDETGHWHVCANSGCEVTDEKAAHTYDSTNCAETANCTVCGYVKAAGEHAWNDGVIMTEPTCTEDGIKAYTCNTCGATKTARVDALGHDFDGIYGYDESTHWPKCSRCGIKNASDEASHNYPEGTDCTMDAICSVCGYEKPAGEHSFGAYEIYQKPTCEEDGIRRATCSVCGATDDIDIYATGHKFGDEPIAQTSPTCTETGSATYKCQNENCDTEITETLGALGHSWSDELGIIKEATCTEAGSKGAICSRCDGLNTLAPIEIPATGHTKNEGTVSKEATCTETGVMSYVCTTCQEAFTETIARIPHDYVDGVCSVCGAVEAVDVTTLSEMQTNLNAGQSVRLMNDIDFGYSALTLSSSMEGTIYLNGHAITATSTAINIGNYDLTIIGAGSITATKYAIYGTNTYTLTVKGATISSTSGTAIYSPSGNESVTLENCTVTTDSTSSNYYGLYVNTADSVKLSGCEIDDLYLKTITELSFENCAITDDCINASATTVSITGGSYVSFAITDVSMLTLDETDDAPLNVSDTFSVKGGGSVTVNGGTFSKYFSDETTGDLTVNGGTFSKMLSKASNFAGVVTISNGTIYGLSIGGSDATGSVVITDGTFGSGSVGITCPTLTISGGIFNALPTLTASKMEISNTTFNCSANLYAQDSLTLGDGVVVPVKNESGSKNAELTVYTDGEVIVNGGNYASGMNARYMTDSTYTGKYIINGGVFGDADNLPTYAYKVNAATELKGGTFYAKTNCLYASASLLVEGTAKFESGVPFCTSVTTVTIRSYGSSSTGYLVNNTSGVIIVDGTIPSGKTIQMSGGILILTENAVVDGKITQPSNTTYKQQLWVKEGAVVNGTITLSNAVNCNEVTSGIAGGVGIAGGTFNGKVSLSGGNTNLTISGGTFTELSLGSNIGSSQLSISGGSFTFDVTNYLTDERMCVYNDETGKWDVTELE